MSILVLIFAYLWNTIGYYFDKNTYENNLLETICFRHLILFVVLLLEMLITIMKILICNLIMNSPYF